jgi:aspartyl-tRNA(Asn)/glutamyl-tRNA(Gln) amidotransferase subunit A
MRNAREIADGVRDGTLSPVDVVEESLANIDALEPDIEAWVEIDRGSALRCARELEQARARGEVLGPLAGVPVGVKDIVDVMGFTTRAGAPPFAHYVPDRDATIARRLREAGAVILGKTHTTEFAYLDPAPTRNPWNRDHTPGGSSSGSAAAVGSSMVPLAIGSQTVGSVLRPAGYCGIVGLKPSFGRLSYAGTLALAASFDHLGFLARDVSDAALALTALSGHDSQDPHSLDAPVEDFVAALAGGTAPRLGIPRNYFEAMVEPDNAAQLEAAAERLRGAGAAIVDVTFPANAQAISDNGLLVMRVEASQAHAQRYAAHKDAYRPNIKGLIEGGLATAPEDFERCRRFVTELREAMQALLSDVDALLLPTAPGVAPDSLETTGPGIFCGPASFTGLPSISLPSGVSGAGMPYSIQLIGPHGGERKLLGVAAWVERVIGFDAKPPFSA